jgi:myosin heavy subunit
VGYLSYVAPLLCGVSPVCALFGQTNIGASILVAVNPYKDLPLYGDEKVGAYVDHSYGSVPPHIFAIAEMAYRSVTEQR